MKHALRLLACLLPVIAVAEVRTGERVVVGPDEHIRDNLTVFAQEARILGRVDGDLVLFSRNARIEGAISGDALVAAQELTVEGKIGGSLRGAASELNVLSQIKEDALLAAANLTVSPIARIGGEFIAAGSNVTVNGPIGDDARIAAGNAKLNSQINGDVRASAGELDLAPGAAIAGNLFYRSGEEVDVASGATVRGDIQRAPVGATERPGVGGVIAGVLYLAMRFFIGIFALGALFVFLFPRFSREAPVALATRPWTSLGWGAVVLIGTPILMTALFVLGALIGGWWIGLILLALYGTAVALSVPISGMALGSWLLQKAHRERAHRIAALALGLGVLLVLGLVPGVNVVVALAVVLFGLGALLVTGVTNRRAASLAAANP